MIAMRYNRIFVIVAVLLSATLKLTPAQACSGCGGASYCPLGAGVCTVCSQCQIPFFPPGSPTTSPDFLGLNTPFQSRPGDADQGPFNGSSSPANGANGLLSGNGNIGGGLANGFGDDLTTAFQGQSTIAPISGSTVVRPGPPPLPGLPGYYYQAPPTASRQTILGRVQGGGDIALAAELLAKENVIVYDQSTPGDIKQIAIDHRGGVDNAQTSELSNQLYSNFIQGANADNLIDVTRGSCFVFIHFSAYMAGPGTGKLPR